MMNSTGNSTRDGSEGPLKLKNELSALVVDDNRVNRKLLMTMLSWAKINAQEVQNGKEAVELHDSGKRFNVIFIDMEMPIMDGPEATRILRSRGIHTMIVGVSGNCRDSDKDKFMKAGINDFQVKPLSRKKFVEILHKVDDEISSN